MFTQKFKPFVCEGDSISCTVDGFDVVATVYRDDTSDKPDQRDDGFWPSKDKKAAGYVLPADFDAAMAKAEQIMAAWKNDEWFYCGVALVVSKADVELTLKYNHALWGIECNYPDSDNSYLSEVANEMLSEALDSARAKLAELKADESPFETVTGTAPSYWATYFINGDSSGMEDSEIAQADQFAEWLGGNIVSCEDAGFMMHHDASQFGVGGADCQTYSALVEKDSSNG